MPLIRVELFDYRINDEVCAKLIKRMTGVVCDVVHESMRDQTFANVEGHSPRNWSVGGRPRPVDEVEV